MNKMNPLHIVALLAVVALFLFVQIRTAKDELSTELTTLKNSKKIALATTAYRDMYANPNKTKRELERIVRQDSKHLTLRQSAQMTTIDSKALSLSELNSFMSKIFNGTYKIQKLQIDKIDKKSARLELEIAW